MNKSQSHCASRKQNAKETKKAKAKVGAGPVILAVWISERCLFGEAQKVISPLPPAPENPIWFYFSSFESLSLVSDHFSWQSQEGNKTGDV